MARGFYTTGAPVDASYTDYLVITVAMPHGSDQQIASMRGALVLFMDKFGIHSSGKINPAEALKLQQEKGTAA